MARGLGGLCSAGGSVTLGMIGTPLLVDRRVPLTFFAADLWQPDDQQYAVAFIVFSSVGGSVLGPVVGGEEFCSSGLRLLGTDLGYQALFNTTSAPRMAGNGAYFYYLYKAKLILTLPLLPGSSGSS